jgi:hypothetical protein
MQAETRLNVEVLLSSAKYDEILEILGKDDTESYAGGRAGRPSATQTKRLASDLGKYFKPRELQQAVLGIDIYHYSRFPLERQRLVPVVFQYLYDAAAEWCTTYESAIFDSRAFDSRFIPTGDGGFQILDTPLQSIVFAVYFQVALTAYNASMNFPALRQFVGPITLRYALTYDTVFEMAWTRRRRGRTVTRRQQDRLNWYGSAIINNARILSRDTLNRFLADDASISWFVDRVRSMESLLILQWSDLRSLGGKKRRNAQPTTSLIFPTGKKGLIPTNAFRVINAQKVGSATIKNTEFDIHSVYAQAALVHVADETEFNTIIALGNLNPVGIITI